MTGTWTYNAATNVLTQTGATSGSPAGFVDAWNFDKATPRALKAATTSPFTASLDTAVKPAESLALKLSVVITNFSVAGTVTLTGKDAWGNAISEVINITGDGTVVSTLYYASIDANGVVAAGTFTAAITQPRLGVVWRQNTRQYQFDCLLCIGDGSTTTYFADTLKQIVWSNFYAFGAYVLDVKANAIVTFGAIVNEVQKSTKNGCDFIVDNSNGWRFYIAIEGGNTYFYSCVFKTVIASGDAWLSWYPKRIWNCQFHYMATRYVANCDFFNTIFAATNSSGALLNTGAGNTYGDCRFFNCGSIVRGDGSTNPFVNAYSRGHTYVAVYISTLYAWYFINPDFDTWAFAWSGTDARQKAYRQYTFDLTTDPSATVTLKDNTGGVVFELVADAATGAIATQIVTRGYYDYVHGNNLVDLGPFTLTITKTGKMPYTCAGLVIDQKTALKITLRDQLTGTATAADVACGKTFYGCDVDSKLIGEQVIAGVFFDVASAKPVLNLNRKKADNRFVLGL